MSENGAPQQKALISDDVLDRSVQDKFDFPSGPGGSSFVIHVGSFADDITMWGRDVWRRDQQLRDFWPTEPFLASAINSIVQARANMSWILDGPPRTVNAVQRVLQSSDLGRGWLSLQQKVATDLLTQDNGAFVEIVRTDDRPDAPVLNLAHLDAGQCVRTGIPDFPVIYTNLKGVRHKLAWYQVLTFEDMPSPIESMNGVQYCFITRVLRAAQILKDIGIFKREKISGRNAGEIHFVGGVQTSVVEDKLRNEGQEANNQGYTRFQLPAIIGSLDPNAPVTTATISLRNVPDGFDEDATLRWYIANLALAAGGDYQDFAPLPSGNIGSGQQSEVLHKKSKGKGHETWRKLWIHKLNFSGVLPRSVTFLFEEDETDEKRDQADLQKTQAETFKVYAESGILNMPVIWQMMSDLQILKPEYMALLGQADVTPEIIVDDEEQGPTQQELTEAETVEEEDVIKALGQLDKWIVASMEVQAEPKKKDGQDRASTQFNMSGRIAEIHAQTIQGFDPSILHEFGVEDESHITVLYGLEDDTLQDVFEVASQFEPFEIELGYISLFQNDEFDVVKIDIESPKLRELNGALAQLPFDNDHQADGYNPHMTLAYVLPGIGAGFVGPCALTGRTCIVDELTFSTSDRNIVKIPLGQSQETKQIDEDVQDVIDELIALVLLLESGGINQAEFESEFQLLMDAGMLSAFASGSGIALEDLSEGDLAFLQEQAAINGGSIPGLITEIEAGDFLPDVGGLDLAARIAIWGRTLTGTFAQGQLAKPLQTFLRWNLGIADHCSTCLELDGVTRTVEDWADTPFRPQVRNGSLECGGWRCKCFWAEVDGPGSGSLPSPAGVIG